MGLTCIITGMVHSALPQLVQAHAQHLLTSSPGRPGIQLLPHQLVANKQVIKFSFLSVASLPITPNLQAVDTGAPPRFTLRQDRVAGTSESWRRWYEAREVEEWTQSVAGVLDQGWNEQCVHVLYLGFPSWIMPTLTFALQGSIAAWIKTLRIPDRL